MGVRRHEDLRAWQLCRELADNVALLLRRQRPADDWDLFNQLRAATRSACRNIAEGFGRFRPREFAPFLRIARGSLVEVGEHLRDAEAAGWLTAAEVKELNLIRSSAIGAVTRLLQYISTAQTPKAKGS